MRGSHFLLPIWAAAIPGVTAFLSAETISFAFTGTETCGSDPGINRYWNAAAIPFACREEDWIPNVVDSAHTHARLDDPFLPTTPEPSSLHPLGAGTPSLAGTTRRRILRS